MPEGEESPFDKYKKEVDQAENHMANLHWDALDAITNTYKNFLEGDIKNLPGKEEGTIDHLYDKLHDNLSEKLGIDLSPIKDNKHAYRNAIDALIGTDHNTIKNDFYKHGSKYDTSNFLDTINQGKMQHLQKVSGAAAAHLDESHADDVIKHYGLESKVPKGYELNKAWVQNNIKDIATYAGSNLLDRFLQQSGDKFYKKKTE
ncbi:MAG: hypothetical protein ACLFTH_00460 [Candidatus Woesearchaeota archaeon]